MHGSMTSRLHIKHFVSPDANVHIATGFHDLITTRDFWSDMARLGAAANTLVFFFYFSHKKYKNAS